MAIVALKPLQKTSPFFSYPLSGQARIYLESSFPLDIFIVNSAQANQVDSRASAERLKVLSLLNVSKIENQIFTLPSAWKDAGWNLIIGNPHSAETAAVYYMVYSV